MSKICLRDDPKRRTIWLGIVQTYEPCTININNPRSTYGSCNCRNSTVTAHFGRTISLCGLRDNLAFCPRLAYMAAHLLEHQWYFKCATIWQRLRESEGSVSLVRDLLRTKPSIDDNEWPSGDFSNRRSKKTCPSIGDIAHSWMPLPEYVNEAVLSIILRKTKLWTTRSLASLQNCK